MSARESILGGIRRSLGRGELSPDAKRELEARIKSHRKNLVPKRAKGGPAARLDRFVEEAEAVQTTTERVASLADVPGAVADYLARHNLPSEVVASPDPVLDGVPWAERPTLGIERRAARESDAASVTPAFAAVAETGTLVLASGAGTPTSLSFLPPNHIVVLGSDQIVGGYEEVWARLRKSHGAALGDGNMPRTVNMITGPSRSGDIGHTLYLGAHGPQRLHVILVDAEDG
jgi:L-lactate dehydrogenase complex protein LldG